MQGRKVTIVGDDVDALTKCSECGRSFVGTHTMQRTCAAPPCKASRNRAHCREWYARVRASRYWIARDAARRARC